MYKSDRILNGAETAISNVSEAYHVVVVCDVYTILFHKYL